MYERIQKILHYISTCFAGEKGEAVPLRIEGVKPAPITPAPDDAELAAAALLESLAEKKVSQKSQKSQKGLKRKKNPSALSHQPSALNQPLALSPQTSSSPQPSKEYYEQLAERVKEGREMEARMTMRFVAYCEEMLWNPRQLSTVNSQLSTLERDLLQRMDIVEREGGELKKRWQRCLAEVTMRQMPDNG